MRHLPTHLHQVSMWHEHHVVLSVSKVEIIILQGWDLSQLASFGMYTVINVYSNSHGMLSRLTVPAKHDM
jgi:hypothetical protein